MTDYIAFGAYGPPRIRVWSFPTQPPPKGLIRITVLYLERQTGACSSPSGRPYMRFLFIGSLCSCLPSGQAPFGLQSSALQPSLAFECRPGFLQTVPRGIALALDLWFSFCYITPNKRVAPPQGTFTLKITPVSGVHHPNAAGWPADLDCYNWDSRHDGLHRIWG